LGKGNNKLEQERPELNDDFKTDAWVYLELTKIISYFCNQAI
jgi:hypothetical protein